MNFIIQPVSYITYLKQGVLFLFAAVCAAEDIKHRSISLRTFIAGGALGSLLYIMQNIALNIGAVQAAGELLKALMPGMVVVIISILTSGAIGIGDGLFVLICGFYTEAKKLFLIFAAAWFLCALVSLFMISLDFTAHKKSKKPLPFIAFMLPMFIVLQLVNYI